MVKLQPVTWLRCRNHGRINHSSRELLRHSTLNDTRNLHIDHGRRGGETFQRNPMDSGGANYLGMGFHSPATALIGYMLERTLAAL